MHPEVYNPILSSCPLLVKGSRPKHVSGTGQVHLGSHGPRMRARPDRLGVHRAPTLRYTLLGVVSDLVRDRKVQ